MDSINYLGWESNFSIRPLRVFKIHPTKFQWTQSLNGERDLVERSAYTIILGNNTKFLVNYFVCDRVKLRSLGRRLLLLVC